MHQRNSPEQISIEQQPQAA